MLMLSIEPSQVAYWLRMSVRTVYRTWMHYEETGDIRPARKTVVLRCVTEEDIAFVKEVIERDSSLYLDEILDLFAEERGKRISSSTLLRVLHIRQHHANATHNNHHAHIYTSTFAFVCSATRDQQKALVDASS